jgi:hypothetical protein
VGPPAASCFEIQASIGQECNEACQLNNNGYYSDTSIPDCGSPIYENSTCTNCDNLRGLFVVFKFSTLCCEINSECQTNPVEPCTSDARLKDEVKTLENVLDNIMKMNAVEFDWAENYRAFDELKEKGKLRSLGFIAQEMRNIYPEVVEVDSDGYYYIIYSELNSVLVEGIKEQQVFIEELEQTITRLENILND